MKIESKQQMYELYEREAFGNKLRTWTSVEDWENSGYEESVAMRYKGEGGVQYPRYGTGLAKDEVKGVVQEWLNQGAVYSKIVLNELAEDHLLILQGEVQRSINFLDMRYSTVKKPMRAALAEAQTHISGLAAMALLKQYMDSTSYDVMWELFDSYDSLDVVIEFSIWAKDVGHIPRRNTVFWEVRSY